MEATVDMSAVEQETPAPALPPTFTRKYLGLNIWTMTLILAALGTVAMDYLFSSGHITLSGHAAFTIRTGALVIIVLNIGMLLCYTVAKLKKNDAALAAQTAEFQQSQADYYAMHAHAENLTANLDYSNNQLSNTLFQLSNANLQFDIITSELDAAKRETDAIFANVRQGLFLIGPDGTIGAQTSEESKAIFQTTDLARRNLVNLLRPLLPEKRHRTIADYFDILFDARKNDKQLQKFNPLKRVELNFPAEEGGFVPRHVEFSFQRIINNGAVSSVMVSALDVTERVKLEEQLREGEVLREKQLELLFEILQVESGPLRRFIEGAESAVGQINTIFMEAGAPGAGLHDKVQRVFRIAHNLKSEAASLGLLLFEKTIHQIENQLNDLRRNPDLVNEDMLNVLVSIANFQNQLKEAGGLIEKISGLRRSFGPGEGGEIGGRDLIGGVLTPANPTTELKQVVEDLARTVASRRGKQARIDWSIEGFDTLPLKHRRLIQHAIFQLVRNSIVHGIELPDNRTAAGKDPCGCIRVSIAPSADNSRVALTCRDDGAGLDAEEIRTHAISEGLIKEAEGKTLSQDDLYALIFQPGFSTVSSAHEDAGRGVGLDVIREEIVEELHGQIRIETTAGQYCEFQIAVPMATA